MLLPGLVLPWLNRMSRRHQNPMDHRFSKARTNQRQVATERKDELGENAKRENKPGGLRSKLIISPSLLLPFRFVFVLFVLSLFAYGIVLLSGCSTILVSLARLCFTVVVVWRGYKEGASSR